MDHEISAFKQECMTEQIIFVSDGLHGFFRCFLWMIFDGSVGWCGGSVGWWVL